MSNDPDRRDFFISFNSADLVYAAAIDSALRAEGFTTFFHPRDLGPGGNIAMWMDEALMNSAQTLALYSPDYMKDTALYSKSERYATWWQDPGGDSRKLIPILLRETVFTPLMSMISRIEVTGLTPAHAGASVVDRLKAPKETKQRDLWRAGLPLPNVFQAAYRPNPNFTGRFEALESLQRSLRSGTSAAITAVSGMGGVGKTTLAAEYCYRFGGRYGGVWWIRAEQKSVMLTDLQALGQRLGVISSENIEVDARATLDHLASLTEPWLLVYDNSPNPDGVRKWLPTGAVRCIITSRFAEFGDVAPVTRLGEWSDEVTADYLLSRAGRDDGPGANRLANRLGGLPLAAEQAAVFLNLRGEISFDDYAAEIARLIRLPKPAGATGEYPDTTYVAFVKSLETIGEMKSGKTAMDLLKLCAFLSPDGVDLNLLIVKGGEEILPASFAAALANKFEREDALAALASLSLLRRDSGPAGSLLIFHRLLLEVVRDWMGKDDRILWGTAAAQLVSEAFPNAAEIDPSKWAMCARIFPHILLLEAYALSSDTTARALGRLLGKASAYLRARGNFEGALRLSERAVALRRRRRNEDPRHFARSVSTLGALYADLDRLADAERTFREGLEVLEPLLNANDTDFASLASNLAAVLLERKVFSDAEPLFLRAAEIMKAAHGIESAEYGIALANLGSLYDRWADHTGDQKPRAIAERYSVQALTVTRAARGTRHPATATLYSNFAGMNEKLSGSLPEAAERAFAIMLSLDLGQHPNMQTIARRLARWWKQSGQPDKAARLDHGDISDLLPVIAQIEIEHHAWADMDPEIRQFGPNSFFTSSQDRIAQSLVMLAACGVDIDDLLRQIQSGALSTADFERMIVEQIAGKTG